MNPSELLRKAGAALASAQRDFAAGDFDGAANRLYYAMFHAARAALISIGRPAEGKHGTIIAQFGLHFCKNGPLPAELGRAMNEAQELRAEGDYAFSSPQRADVQAYLEKAETFVAAIAAIISTEPRDGT